MKKFGLFNILFIVFGILLLALTIIFKWSFLSLALCLLTVYGFQLQTKRNRLGLILVLIANVLYSYVAYRTRYFGDAIFFTCISIPMLIATFIIWSKHLDDKKLVIPAKINLPIAIVSIVVAGLAIFGYGKILEHFKDIHPYLDASSSVVCILGYLLRFMRYKEHWGGWIIQNIITIIMYVLVGNVLLIIFGAICLIQSAYGIIIWKSAE